MQRLERLAHIVNVGDVRPVDLAIRVVGSYNKQKVKSLNDFKEVPNLAS